MEKSSFFNSVGGDRKYDAADWAAYFASLIGNGVFGSPSSCLQVQPGENTNLRILEGSAWINGYYYVNTNILPLEMTTPDGILNRIDRVVVRWSLIERAITVKIKIGAPGSNPLAPALQRDAGVYELALADVYVPAGAASILESNITDLRGNAALCGTVSSIVSEAHSHEAATQTKSGFMSANDKKNLDTVSSRVNQDVSTTASPTFKIVTAEKVIGAVYA